MLIVVPSLISGLGLGFILAAILINEQILQDLFYCLGAVLLWSDFFVTMAIFRHSIRSIDRRLKNIEEATARSSR